MYYISDDNSFMKMMLLNNVKSTKKNLIENRFWLSLQADVIAMIRQNEGFVTLPKGLQEYALDEVTQEVLVAVYKSRSRFVNNSESKNAGSRVNWLKEIVNKKMIDFQNKNRIFINSISLDQDDLNGVTYIDKQETPVDSTIEISDVYFFAKYYVFFMRFHFRLKSKFMYLYKDMDKTRYKMGKNGGASGNHNCLVRLEGKTMFEIRDNILEELQGFVGFVVPDKYMVDIMNSITVELMKIRKGDFIGNTIFEMKSKTAREESSRIDRAFSIFDDDINEFATILYDEVYKMESMMTNNV